MGAFVGVVVAAEAEATVGGGVARDLFHLMLLAAGAVGFLVVVVPDAEADEADKVVNVEIEKVGDRPAGQQPIDCDIVQATAEAYRVMGFEPRFNASSSVDANVPISMGIPGLAIGGGGSQGNAHSKNEWYAPTDDKAEGTFKLFLLLCGLCGVEGVSEPMLPIRNPK